MEKTKAKKYNNIKLALSLSGMAIDLAFWLVLIFSGLNIILSRFSQGFTDHLFIHFYIFAGILGIVNLVIKMPLSFYGGYVVEHKFSLTTQKFGQWLWEQLKGFLVGIVLGFILMTIFYYLLWKQPTLWWFYLWLFILAFSILLSRLAPVLIFPLFYKFKPLENEAIKERINSIARKNKLHISGIFQFNLSKTTKKANAAFTGIGKTKRVILGDTLLDNFSEDEIETVFAHEVGHYRYKHLWKGIAINSALSLAGLFLVYVVYSAKMRHLDYLPQQLEALPYLGLLLYIYGFITGPISNAISRHFEYQADNFAVTETSKPEVYKGCLEKLADLNLADQQPHPLVEFLFYSHPSIEHRIEKISGEMQ
jgi:STE24 endopeptidase